MNGTSRGRSILAGLLIAWGLPIAVIGLASPAAAQETAGLTVAFSVDTFHFLTVSATEPEAVPGARRILVTVMSNTEFSLQVLRLSPCGDTRAETQSPASGAVRGYSSLASVSLYCPSHATEICPRRDAGEEPAEEGLTGPVVECVVAPR